MRHVLTASAFVLAFAFAASAALSTGELKRLNEASAVLTELRRSGVQLTHKRTELSRESDQSARVAQRHLAACLVGEYHRWAEGLAADVSWRWRKLPRHI